MNEQNGLEKSDSYRRFLIGLSLVLILIEGYAIFQAARAGPSYTWTGPYRTKVIWGFGTYGHFFGPSEEFMGLLVALLGLFICHKLLQKKLSSWLILSLAFASVSCLPIVNNLMCQWIGPIFMTASQKRELAKNVNEIKQREDLFRSRLFNSWR